ncbi:MAG: lipopolysaccharide biosynthesis protein [Proteobacteria bacterium]|nr:lipopolysaccharide biosynthesis protein [Pseudomonadota bacterium]
MASTGSTGLKLFREGGLYTLGLFFMRAGNFLLLPLYTALLTKEELGAYGVVKDAVMLLVMLSIVGQSHALLRLGTEREGDPDAVRKLISSVFTYVIGAAVVLTAVAFVVWPSIGRRVDNIPLTVAAAGLVGVAGQAGFNLVMAWLQFGGKAGVHTRLNVFRWFVMLILIFVLVVGLGWKTEGLLLATAISFSIGALWGIRKLEPRPSVGIDGPSLKDSLVYGIPLLPHALAGIIFQATDKVLLAAHPEHGLNATGMYLLGAQLGSIVFMFAMGMQRAWVPFVMREDRDRDSHDWSKVRVLSFFVVTVVATVSVGVGLLAPELVAITSAFASKSYAPAAAVVPILAFGGFLRSYYLVNTALVMANKATARWLALATLPAAAVNVFLNARWIPEHGLVGAAWATTTSHGLSLLLVGIMARRARKVPLKFGKAAVLAPLVGATLYFAHDQTLVVRIGAMVGFGLAAFALDAKDIGGAARSVLRQRSKSK